MSTSPQLAVVTGASSGIGRAIALALAGRGHPLCLIGRSRDRLEAVAGLATGNGVETLILEADLADLNAVAALGDRLGTIGRPVDRLVHSAAMMALAPVEASTVADFVSLLTVNLLSPFALTRALLPQLRATRGQIVFVNSSAVHFPSAGTAQYAASKHALKGLADAVRQEVNPSGVRVISIYPGRTATPLQEELARQHRRDYDPASLLQPEDVAAMVIQALDLPRTAEVTDIHVRPAIKS